MMWPNRLAQNNFTYKRWTFIDYFLLKLMVMGMCVIAVIQKLGDVVEDRRKIIQRRKSLKYLRLVRKLIEINIRECSDNHHMQIQVFNFIGCF